MDADELQTRVQAARARRLSPSEVVVANGISRHIARARNAAYRRDPIPGRWTNWWRGTLVEAAYRNLHAARAQSVDLLTEDQLHAEVPAALARAQASLGRDDPRLVAANQLAGEEPDRLRAQLRQLTNDSYQVLDGRHAQLRSFRNILLMTALLVTVLVGLTLFFVSQNPTALPLCFPRETTVSTNAELTQVDGLNCPTASGPEVEPSGGDVLIVALLGALGGALAAAVAIRNLKGTSTPYDVPVALAVLKVPLGAFTAILAIVAIQGDFVPGLSVLDSQEQILAYALVFGFAQQVFTRLLDQRAQTLLEELPGGTAGEKAPPPTVATSPSAMPAPEPPTEPRTAGRRQVASVGGMGAGTGLAAAEDDDPLVEADLPSADVEMLSSDDPEEPEVDEHDLVAAPVIPPDEVADPDPLTDQNDDDLQDDVPEDEAPQVVEAEDDDPLVEADLPSADVEMLSSDDPEEPEVDEHDLVATPVIPPDEVADPDPLTDQNDDDLQDDVPEDEE